MFFISSTTLFSFYGSIVAQGVGQVLGNPTAFFGNISDAEMRDGNKAAKGVLEARLVGLRGLRFTIIFESARELSLSWGRGLRVRAGLFPRSLILNL
jgi:hypothetical protein